MPTKSPVRTGTPAESQPLGLQVNLVARLLESALRPRIAPLGVAPGQIAALLTLYERDGRSQAELCDAVHIDQSTMAHTLSRMERDGLITRVASQQDKRRKEIYLTDRARELQSTLIASGRDVGAVATRGVNAADIATTRRVLAQVLENLRQQAPLAGSEASSLQSTVRSLGSRTEVTS